MSRRAGHLPLARAGRQNPGMSHRPYPQIPEGGEAPRGAAGSGVCSIPQSAVPQIGSSAPAPASPAEKIGGRCSRPGDEGSYSSLFAVRKERRILRGYLSGLHSLNRVEPSVHDHLPVHCYSYFKGPGGSSARLPNLNDSILLHSWMIWLDAIYNFSACSWLHNINPHQELSFSRFLLQLVYRKTWAICN